MVENWNELQDAMPHNVKIDRKEPFALRSHVSAVERRCSELEDAVRREKRLSTMVRIIVWIMILPTLAGFVVFVLEVLAALRGN